MWFKNLTGFEEISPGQVRSNLILDGNHLTSTANGSRLIYGNLETPTLADLRKQVNELPSRPGLLQVSEVVADVGELHT